MAPQLTVSGSTLIQQLPSSTPGFLRCAGSPFCGGGSGTSTFQPALYPLRQSRRGHTVRADISNDRKPAKRVVAANASKGGAGLAEKGEGTQAVTERGASNPGKMYTPPKEMSSQRVEALRRAARQRPKTAPRQQGPFDWVGELAFGNPIAKGVQKAVGTVAVAAGAGLFREVGPGGVEAPEVDYALRGNFAPVPELEGRMPVRVLEGAVPSGFPDGVYVRNGPNPQFMPKTYRSLTGSLTKYHWFEGDGMLHAVRFQNGKPSYQNKFVGTEGYKLENEAGKPVLMGTLAAGNLLENMAVNSVLHGIGFKQTANTHVVGHHGRLLALMEAGPPHEVDMDDLTTVGVYDFDGQLDFPFTAHPKIDPRNGDMVFFGYAVTPPYCSVGVASKTGELVHKTPLDVKRPTMMHDFAITENYNVILDFPLTFDFQRKLRGGELIEFEPDQPARFGVMPRFGGRESVRWFETATCFAFHTLNAYEDGNEIVLYGCASKNPALSTPPDQSASEWFAEHLGKPDGGLKARLTEWRINLKTGGVTEKMLTPLDFSADMPRINDNYAGFRNRFGYGLVTDTDATVREGMPLHTSIVKYYLPDEKNAQVPIKMEFHNFGPDRFGSEPSFVPRDGATEEDDGWLVCFVYDRNTDTSELLIVDAQRFSEPPVARLAIPQRVPFGLHGSFVPLAA
ncbi:hypothetical protein KFL_001380020 [Klebsormidium nitens]|uniref:Carotenoid oxygenase n=1 Tax=Klebsormidium nitens TaxID=105231 RepID=A0A1Y1HWX3_KLENI|nr:hypothetical protein KFL_001380020 [Klebsormidium nitens]|eukprot:GAQ83160.1 hypothetical protein KFL_001380020 [Klebsormidium nitens]